MIDFLEHNPVDCCSFFSTSGIVLVVYSLSGGKHEVPDSDRNSFDNRWDVFLGLSNGEDSE